MLLIRSAGKGCACGAAQEWSRLAGRSVVVAVVAVVVVRIRDKSGGVAYAGGWVWPVGAVHAAALPSSSASAGTWTCPDTKMCARRWILRCSCHRRHQLTTLLGRLPLFTHPKKLRPIEILVLYYDFAMHLSEQLYE